MALRPGYCQLVGAACFDSEAGAAVDFARSRASPAGPNSERGGRGSTTVTNLLLRLLASAGAVLLAQAIFPRYVQVGGLSDALVFAIVLGVLNALVRPILLLLTCPITLLTLGLFVFVVNALVFWLGTQLWPGVQVDSVLGALIGSLLVSVCSTFANAVLK